MKKLILTLILIFAVFPAFAEELAPDLEGGWLKPVEAKYVCMVNNARFEREQIAIEVDGKTYYGCCPMCRDMLKNDATMRLGSDPVSGEPVDKAAAIIGADPQGKVYYFESQENFDLYAKKPAPKEHKHDESMRGIDELTRGEDGMQDIPVELDHLHHKH